MNNLRLFVAQDEADGTLSTVGSVIDRYLAHLSQRHAASDYSAQALENARRELLAFADLHGGKPLSECRRHDLTQWLDSHPQWKSNWTKKRVLDTLCRPFLWAADLELIAASPYRKPKGLRLPTRPRREAMASEYVTLMRGGSRCLRRALFFLRRSGARTCEMRDVTWPEVDLGRGVIRLDEHKTVRQTKDPLPRLIPLDRALVRFLGNLQRQRRPGSLHVFVNNHGTPWTRHALARHFRRTADRLGLAGDLSAYCLRHSYGAAAIEAGIGERQVADAMGHTSTRMTSYYAKTAGKIDYLRRVAEAVAKQRRRS
jgi:integrase